MKPNSLFALGSLIVIVGLGAAACTDNSGNGAGNPGAAGSGGGTAGSGGSTAGTGGSGGTSSAGTGGASTGGTGGTTPGFMAIAPCTSESNYMSGTGDAGTPTIDFGLIGGGFAYAPNCLKVPAGSTVTFSGDFTSHPLEPSAMRGDTANNPITAVSANPDGAMTTSFTFPRAGFYAYFCEYHGSSDNGAGMAGVIWVQ